MKKTIWLSYDLGVKGDYAGLYEWLDNLDAKECGGSLAVFQYSALKDDEDDISIKLRQELEENVNFSKSDRIYIIWKSSEAQ